MGEFIGEMAAQFVLCIPTKKQRIVNKKFKLLRQQKWFQDKYGSIVFFNSNVKDFIMGYDIDKMLKDDSEIMIFQKELNRILKK
ncbi:hypothetical protein V7183_25075 [Bacillus sp. JJ1127]|uniref:hypothetical protein n=1 Tax=Bacillus sp. JJ1127 TaxID=3122952 RepID=UPI002FFE8077